MSNLKWSRTIVQDLHNYNPSADKLYGINKCYDMSTWEINLYTSVLKNKYDYSHDYEVFGTLATCQVLRHKLSVLNRRLLKVKAENRRLRKLLDGLKSIEIED